MVQFLAFVVRLAGEVDAELLEDTLIDLRENDGRVGFKT